MITNQPNIDYTVKYAKLFEDAIKVLHDEFNVAKDVEQFTSLEEYFMYIGYFAEEHNKIVKNIYESNTTDRSEWNTEFATYSKYLMLPLNEEYFVINANTRAISVPALFASHGVSLDGDYHAETLMFEIDRYFDTKDLICTNIII
jgi:hypothetical protein